MLIAKAFNIHSLTIEDILDEGTREKCELFSNYLFICTKSGIFDVHSGDTGQTVNLYILLFSRFALTFHRRPVRCVKQVLKRIYVLSQKQVQLSAEWIMYALLDYIVDEFGPQLQDMETEVDLIDEMAISQACIGTSSGTSTTNGTLSNGSMMTQSLLYGNATIPFGSRVSNSSSDVRNRFNDHVPSNSRGCFNRMTDVSKSVGYEDDPEANIKVTSNDAMDPLSCCCSCHQNRPTYRREKKHFWSWCRSKTQQQHQQQQRTPRAPNVSSINNISNGKYSSSSNTCTDCTTGRHSLQSFTTQPSYNTGLSGQLLLQRIGYCKKRLMRLRRILQPKADMLKALTRGTNVRFHAGTLVFLRDIQDHLIQMTQALDTYVDTIERAHGTYLAHISVGQSITANQMSDVVKRMTVIAFVLMPVSMLSGIWGMNVAVPGTKEFAQNPTPFCLLISIMIGSSIFFTAISKIFKLL